jgi:hypothetical protein
MASTYTLNNGIELIGTGEQSGTWGDTTNTNLELIDTALDGQISLTLSSAGSSGSPNALPVSDGASSNGRNRLISYVDSGDLGATAYVQLTPNDAEKIIYIRNALSGSRSIIVFQGTYNASNDYEIPAGTTAVVYFNGGGTGAVAANVFNNAYFDGLRLGSVSVTAILDEDNMASNSATALSTQQSIKAYVDSQVGTVDTLAEILANGNTTGGTDIAVSANDDITFADSSKAIFGAGSDLQIYHDGSDSYISDTGTGGLIVRASDSIKLQSSGAEFYFQGIKDGAVKLYYDNAEKLITTSTGISVAGNIANASGDFAIDVAGDIELNADGSTIVLKDNTLARFTFNLDSTPSLQVGGTSLEIETTTDNADILFKGSDGGSAITALTLDMSAAGAATFNAGATFASNVAITTADNSDTLTLVSTDADANGGPILVFDRASGSPANNDLIGQIEFQARNNAAQDVDYAGIDSYILDVTDGSEDGELTITTMVAGTTRNRLDFTNTQTIVNESGIDVDFRVESDSSTHMLFVDAGKNGIGLGTGSIFDHQQGTGIDINYDGTIWAGNTYWAGGLKTGTTFYTTTAGDKFKHSNRQAVQHYINSQGGSHHFYSSTGGTAGDVISWQEIAEFDRDEAVFNNGGVDQDFRVESDTDTHALFVDASSNTIGLGLSNPSSSYKLNINGNLRLTGTAGTVRLEAGDTSLGADQLVGRVEMYANDTSTGGTGVAGYIEVKSDDQYGVNSYMALGTRVSDGSGNPTERLKITKFGGLITTPIANGDTIFNENGVDADFRVESDSSTHMLFVDAGNNYVGIGSATNYSAKLTVQGNKALTAGIPNYQLSVVDDTAMAAGTGGAINFWGKYTTSGSKAEGASIEAYKANATSGDYQYGILLKSRTQGGSMDDRLYMDQTKTVFNETGANTDFRIESDSNANMLFVDAGSDAVAIGTNSTTHGDLTVFDTGTTGGQLYLSDTTLGVNYGGFIRGKGVTGSGGYLYMGTVDANTQVVGYSMAPFAQGHTFYTRSGSLGDTDARVNINTTDLVVNNPGNDYDFRVASDSNSAALFVEASSGTVCFGKSSSAVGTSGGAVSGNSMTLTIGTGNTYHLYDGSNYKFYVNANGGIYNYSGNDVNLSDQREKKNIEALGSQWDALKQWDLKKFHYNSDDDSDAKKLGVIAQDVQVNHPDLISDFQTNENETRLAVKEQQMMWMAIKALQEAQEKIETLEDRITALENA